MLILCLSLEPCFGGQEHVIEQLKICAEAERQWEGIHTALFKEHSGLAGSIINRAEAQTVRLALICALLDGQNVIRAKHLDAALALWHYAQESTLYIFGDRAADPLEEKILEAQKQGPLKATKLSAVFSRNVSDAGFPLVGGYARGTLPY